VDRFEVSFESVAWVHGRGAMESIHDLPQSFLDGFNETARNEGLLPVGVCEIKSTYIQEDESNALCSDNSGMKIYVGVVLLVEADVAREAKSFEPPVDLLTKVADAMVVVDGVCVAELYQSWEVVDIDSNPMPYSASVG